MTDTILVTGGAGFIGRHLTRRLLASGRKVRVFDNLLDQVHGGTGRPPADIDGAAFVAGDMRDADAVRRAVQGVDAVVHLAAEVGVGQSMYAIDRYVGVNDLGTAHLFQALAERPVRRVVVASSMSIYGEGLYRDADGRLLDAVERAPRTSAEQGWDPLDAQGRPLVPVPTPESKRPSLASVYALTKYVQERLTLTLTAAYGMEGVALRLFNVYGPGQALSNPYTGVLAIFASRLLNGKPPLVFEDGAQRRDFVHVSDVAAAFEAALDHPEAPGRTFNVASGRDVSILDVARDLAAAMGRPELTAELAGKSRVGDIRHCIADISAARSVLGFAARKDWNDGLVELADWVASQTADDRVAEARRELEARGLVA